MSDSQLKKQEFLETVKNLALKMKTGDKEALKSLVHLLREERYYFDRLFGQLDDKHFVVTTILIRFLVDDLYDNTGPESTVEHQYPEQLQQLLAEVATNIGDFLERALVHNEFDFESYCKAEVAYANFIKSVNADVGNTKVV